MTNSAFSVNPGTPGVTSIATAGLASGGTITTTGTITVTAASKSDQETATSTSVCVLPSVQQYHPSACTMWGYLQSNSGAIVIAYNISTETKNATGDYTIAFTTSYSSGNYSALVCAQLDSISTANTNLNAQIASSSFAAGGFRFMATNGANTLADCTGYFVCSFGVQ